MIERYKTDGNPNNDGMTVVNMDGDKSLVGMDTTLDNGEYVDQVYGGKLVVNNKKITSGEVKSGKVHVFYNASNSPRASLAVTGAKSFKTDTTQVTLTARNVNNARYSTSEGDSGSFTDGQKVTIGAKSAVNTQITVTLTGTDADGKQITASETFTKKDPNATVSYTAYAKKPAAWNKIYAYVYVDNNAPAGSVIQNAAWPGELMTAESGACDGTADQVYEIPEEIIDKAGDDPIRVIFNNGGAGEIAGNKFPGDSATEDPGDHVDAAGLLIDGSYVWDGNITSGTWEEASCLAVTVDSVKINPRGTINLDLANGATTQLTATVAPAAAANKPVKWTSSNEKVAVVKNGVVQGLAKGTATITASVGGKSDSVTVNVTGEAPVVHDTTIYYSVSNFGANSTYLHYRTGTGTWTTAPGVKMEAACDGYVKYTIEGTEGGQVEFVFNNGAGQWDNNGKKNYTASGANAVVENGTVGSVAPCVTVIPVSSVSITGSGVSNGKATISVGTNLNLTATVSPSNATVGAVYWSSSDTSVATVDGSGKVTAKAEGVTAITVTAGGRSQAIILTVTAAPRFADVPFDHQFYADIEWLAASGITSGDGSGNYSPWANVNRGQMAAFMYRMAVKRGNALAATYKPSAADYDRFPDVGRDTQFAKEILWAASVGLTNGDGSGGFSPYADCNRAQMSAFLQRFARLHGDALAGSYKPSAADYNRFPDVGRDHHFANSILWAASVGLTSGDGSGGFSPYADCNRAQMAAFLHRLDNHLN